MGMSVEDYRHQLTQLLPHGPAWDLEINAGVAQAINLQAAELARADATANQIALERDPRYAWALLGDWERLLGLPDECSAGQAPGEVRRARVVQKLTAIGGQSRAYFIGVAAMLGYPGGTVQEFAPMTCVSRCNDSLTNGAWQHAWALRLPQTTRINTMTALSGCNESLRDWGDAELECIVRKLAPAHTYVLFSYGVY